MNPKTQHHTLWTILFMTIATWGSLTAEKVEVEITSTVNATRISLHDKLVFTATMTAPSFLKDYSLSPSPTEDFDVIWASTMLRRDSTMKIIVRETYIFVPKKIGLFEIGKLDFRQAHDKVPVHTIEVLDGPRLLDQKDPESYHTVPWGDYAIFLKSSVTTREPYVGEQVTTTFEHFDNIYKTEAKFMAPAAIGFYVVDLPDLSDILTKIDGVNYWLTVYHTALFPSRPGELTIGKSELRYSSKQGVSSQWGLLSSPPFTLHVKPLPDKNKPSHFSGAVGNFTVTVSAYPLIADVKEEITLKATIEGDGNLCMIPSLEEPDLSSFRIYNRSEKEDISHQYDPRFTVGGTKSWYYSLIPEKSGLLTIQPFSLSFFNPQDKTYHTVSSQPVTLKVREDSTAVSGKNFTENQRSVIETIASDIRYLKPDKQTLKSANTGILTPWYFIVLFTLPPTILVTSFALKKRHDVRAHDRMLIRRRSAWKNARQRLEKASKLLDNGDASGYYGMLHTCIVSFIEDRLDQQPGTVNSLSLMNTLVNYGVPRQLAGQVVMIVELCERIEFSQDGLQVLNHRKILNDAEALIKELTETI